MSKTGKVVRRSTHEVLVGAVGVGGANPLRVQSMTTSDTQDVDATVRQAIALAEVGCEIVRITAPNPAAAKCLGPIRKKLSEAGFSKTPLVADIHFLPSAAMEAIERNLPSKNIATPNTNGNSSGSTTPFRRSCFVPAP